MSLSPRDSNSNFQRISSSNMLFPANDRLPDVLRLIEPVPPLVALDFFRAVFNLVGQREDLRFGDDEAEWLALYQRIAKQRPAIVEVALLALREVYKRLLVHSPDQRERTTVESVGGMFQRIFFELLSRSNPSHKSGFINLGYVCDAAIELKPEDESNRYAIQLYHQLFSAACRPAKIAGKDIVEVGCGRGGGSDYVARCLRPRRVTGVDLARASIDYCLREYDVSGLEFRVGDAMSLPLDDDCCDVVINVESSHCYSSMARFLIEVKRVLRPGGYFLLTDMRHHDKLTRLWESLAALDSQLTASGLELLERRDVTAAVSRAIELDGKASADRWLNAPLEPEATNDYKAAMNYCREHLRYAITITWAARLKSRSYIYMSYVLRKPSAKDCDVLYDAQGNE